MEEQNKIKTSPFRHRDKLDAQSLLDCDEVDCVSIENDVTNSLKRFER